MPEFFIILRGHMSALVSGRVGYGRKMSKSHWGEVVICPIGT